MATKEKNKKKAIKEPKKDRMLKVKLNITKLENYKVPPLPEELTAWDNESEMSKEYCEMVEMATNLARYLAVCCNEGPETKDSTGKRMITAKLFLKEFLSNLSISGWLLYGLLFEQLNDVYDNITGRYNTIKLLKEIHKRQKLKKPQHINSTKEYVS